MTRDEAKEWVLQQEPTFLEEVGTANGRPSYECPQCGYRGGSTHHIGQGLIWWKGSDPSHPRWTCFGADDGKSRDIIELWEIHYRKTENANASTKEIFDTLYDYYGIEIDGGIKYRTKKKHGFVTKSANSSIVNKRKKLNEQIVKIEVDFIDFFKECAVRIEQTDYHRGISLKTLKRFGVGYDPEWRNPAVNLPIPSSPMLIIPTSRHTYFARRTDGYEQYNKFDVGGKRIFNERALDEATRPIFVCEGAIDALSVMEVGGVAISTGGIAGNGMLLEKVKQKKPVQPLIIAYDNDNKGIFGSNKLESMLSESNIPFYRPKEEVWLQEYKDPNGWLNADREAFSNRVLSMTDLVAKQFAVEYSEISGTTTEDDMAEVQEKSDKSIEQSNEALNKECAGHCIDEFFNRIRNNIVQSIPTGFDELDKILDGGLTAGLYIVGAVSSLGKTTFCLQIADNIAEAGYDVLIFSLEMARYELMAKSISRLTYILDKKNKGKNAKTTRGIMKGGLYNVYTQEELELIDAAVKSYKGFADHIFIVEGVGNVTAQTIKDKVQQHKEATGKVPVVLIDYLQIIAPEFFDARSTDKQIVDKAVLSLKRLSRDFSTPVIGISSFNRDNYYQSVNMTSFKESGAIEYSSDVLIGLQYKIMERKDNETEENRRSRVRDELQNLTSNCDVGKPLIIQAKVLKNRNGARGSVELDFYPMFNAFQQNSKQNNEHSTDEFSIAFDDVAVDGVANLQEMAKKCGISSVLLKAKLIQSGKYIVKIKTVEKISN